MATGKIIIYEHVDFQGDSRELTADTSNLTSVGLNDKVSSIKVYGSVWAGYEHADYKGRQYILEEGNYPNWGCWQGSNDQLSSLKKLKMNPPNITLYQHTNYGGTALSLQCPANDLRSHQFNDQASSIKVLNGIWILYEHIDFTGRQYIVTKGDYPNWDQWRGANDQISSLRPVKKPACEK
ncbi:beta-crystallin B3-like [Amphiura filiformis]|uniref:beta-crystallin B3-like n=1 Tax=Amphiura filiformis TaxID=82378 RepID=UPI003B212D7B